MLEPVGPLPARVYWIRRLAVFAVILAVVGLLGWTFLGRNGSAGAATTTPGATTAPTTVSTLRLTGELAIPTTTTVTPFAITTDTAGTTAVVGPAEGAGAASDTPDTASNSDPADPAAASAAAESAASVASAQSAAAAASAAAASEAAAAAAASQAAAAAASEAAAAAAASAAARQTDAQGRLICPDSALTLTATVGAPTYRVGEQPIVGVTVANTSSEACVRDLSGSLQEYVAFDGAGNRVWSTNDCAPGEGTDVRMLEAGQSVQYNIRWSGKSSQPGCAGERSTVAAGTYAVEARIGTLVSARKQLEFR